MELYVGFVAGIVATILVVFLGYCDGGFGQYIFYLIALWLAKMTWDIGVVICKEK